MVAINTAKRLALMCLLGVSVLVAAGALWRYGDRLIWRFWNTDTSLAVQSVKTQPLRATDCIDQLVPIVFDGMVIRLPATFSPKNNGTRNRALGDVIVFTDEECDIVFQTIDHTVPWFPPDIAGNVNRPNTSPRYIRELFSASSDDFSFFMSEQDFEWHRALLRDRALEPKNPLVVEYFENTEVSASLLVYSTRVECVWSTHDGKVEGKCDFLNLDDPRAPWVRCVMASLRIADQSGGVQ